MKVTYMLICRNGWNENIEIEFCAYNIIEAQTMAMNWMKQNYIKQGWLTVKSGKRYFVAW